MDSARYFSAECEGERFTIAVWTEAVEITVGGFPPFYCEPDRFRRFAPAYRMLASNKRPVRLDKDKIIFADTEKQIAITGFAEPFEVTP